MKVLSLLQPWASLAVMGVKTIETRSWQTTHRGELLIHASSGKKGRVLCDYPLINQHIKNFDQLVFGAIVGSVVLHDVVPVETLHFSAATLATLTLEEQAFGDVTKGRYAWLFTRAVQFHKPIFLRGSLGLWNYIPV